MTTKSILNTTAKATILVLEIPFPVSKTTVRFKLPACDRNDFSLFSFILHYTKNEVFH